MSTNVQKSKKVFHLSARSRSVLSDLYFALEHLLDSDADPDGLPSSSLNIGPQIFHLISLIYMGSGKDFICKKTAPSLSGYADVVRFQRQADWCLVRLPIEKLRLFEKWIDGKMDMFLAPSGISKEEHDSMVASQEFHNSDDLLF